MAETINRQLPSWVQQHIDEYLATNGERGHVWNGVPTLLLTTTGRRTGRSLLLPLIYGRDGDSYLVVASRGGAKDHPAWYKNLVATPGVDVQVKDERFKARARTAAPDEKRRLWKTMTAIWPAYDDYQTRTARDIPVVVLERQ